MKKTLVLIPTYNEKDNIPILVTDLMAIPGVSVMVLDDQSPDGTGKVADELGVEVSRAACRRCIAPGQRGLGVSYLEGFHRAIESDYDFVCQMDADLSHDPKYLPAMIERGRRRRRSRDRLAISQRHQRGELAAAPHHPEPVRQLLHPHRHRPAHARHHDRLSLLAPRHRWRSCRSIASSPTATRSCSTSRSWPPTPACASSSRRSSSSSGARARRSCRAAC